MNKLLVALISSAVALGSATALAQSKAPNPYNNPDNTLMPLSKMESQDAKAARDAAKAKWASMTPEEKAATKKAAQAKKRSELNALEELGADSIAYDAKQGAKDTAASKAQPVPTKAERQQDLTNTIKKSGPAQ